LWFLDFGPHSILYNDAEFKKRNLTTSEKTAKKNKQFGTTGENPNSIPIGNTAQTDGPDASTGSQPPKKKKKVYTPFPPPQQPSKVNWREEMRFFTYIC
jgi:ribosomal RNA assembly protein